MTQQIIFSKLALVLFIYSNTLYQFKITLEIYITQKFSNKITCSLYRSQPIFYIHCKHPMQRCTLRQSQMLDQLDIQCLFFILNKFFNQKFQLKLIFFSSYYINPLYGYDRWHSCQPQYPRPTKQQHSTFIFKFF